SVCSSPLAVPSTAFQSTRSGPQSRVPRQIRTLPSGGGVTHAARTNQRVGTKEEDALASLSLSARAKIEQEPVATSAPLGGIRTSRPGCSSPPRRDGPSIHP